jgi:hypothetical protein
VNLTRKDNSKAKAVLKFHNPLCTRLTPPYAVVILFVATLYRHVGSGPLLPAVTSGQAEDCQKYWWTNILYINNYVAIDHMVTGIFITFPLVFQIFGTPVTKICTNAHMNFDFSVCPHAKT